MKQDCSVRGSGKASQNSHHLSWGLVESQSHEPKGVPTFSIWNQQNIPRLLFAKAHPQPVHILFIYFSFHALIKFYFLYKDVPETP